MNEKFSANNSDIKVRSADGIEFDLHRTLLEAYTGAFPGPELDTCGEAIQLTESGNVLGILFEFVYPKRHPDLEDKDFELVAAVAEAVGKYEVYSAVNTCNTQLRSFLPGHSTEIFVYAIKHDHPKLADEAALHIARLPLISILKKLPSYYLLPWAQFHEEWSSIFKEARRHIKNMPSVSQLSLCHSGSTVCNTCRSSLYSWVINLEEIATVSELRADLVIATFKNPGLSCCKVPAKANPDEQRSLFPAPAPQQQPKCDHIVTLAKACHEKVEVIPLFSKFVGREKKV